MNHFLLLVEERKQGWRMRAAWPLACRETGQGSPRREVDGWGVAYPPCVCLRFAGKVKLIGPVRSRAARTRPPVIHHAPVNGILPSIQRTGQKRRWPLAV